MNPWKMSKRAYYHFLGGMGVTGAATIITTIANAMDASRTTCIGFFIGIVLLGTTIACSIIESECKLD